jgi:hypothetical protein
MSTKAQTETVEKRVKKLLADFAPLAQQVRKVCAVRDLAVQSERERFDKACEPLNIKANKKLKPLNEQIQPIAREIESLLCAAVDKRGVALFKTVEVRDARAEVKQQVVRWVDPEKLLEFVPQADRTPAFWECYDVLIGKTAKFLGDGIDQLAEPDYKTPKVLLSLK